MALIIFFCFVSYIYCSKKIDLQAKHGLASLLSLLFIFII